MQEVQTMEYILSPKAILNQVYASFTMHSLSESVLIPAMTTLSELENMLVSSFSKVNNVSTEGSAHSSVCS